MGKKEETYTTFNSEGNKFIPLLYVMLVTVFIRYYLLSLSRYVLLEDYDYVMKS